MEKIFNTVNSILMTAGMILGLAAPIVLMRAVWILCSTH